MLCRSTIFALAIGAIAVSAAVRPAEGSPEDSPVAVDPQSGSDDDGEGKEEKKKKKKKNSGWVVLPGAFYTTEKGSNISSSLIYYFRPGEAEDRPSRLKFSANLSTRLEGEFNIIPTLWLDRDRLQITSNNKFSYRTQRYYDIGNNTTQADAEDFLRTRITSRTEVIRTVMPSFFVGAFYQLRQMTIEEAESGGLIEALDRIETRLVSGLGIAFRYDTRDNVFAPYRGTLITLDAGVYHTVLGSKYNFAATTLRASYFLRTYKTQVLAFDSGIDLRVGDVPFDQLAQAGGKRLLRGMRLGRFRDNHYIAAQVEYRLPLFWRVGFAAFTGVGRVAENIEDFRLQDLKYSLGTGLRFTVDKLERIHARADFAISNDDLGIYLKLLEAF